MRWAAEIAAIGLVLYGGYRIEQSKRIVLQELQELIRLLIFAAQEISGRGTPLIMLFGKAASYCGRGAGKLAANLSKGLQEDRDFREIWNDSIEEFYGGLALTDREREVLCYISSSFLLPKGKLIEEQLVLDARQLEELCRDRKGRLETDCRLCRCLSFSLAAFLSILIW